VIFGGNRELGFMPATLGHRLSGYTSSK